MGKISRGASAGSADPLALVAALTPQRPLPEARRRLALVLSSPERRRHQARARRCHYRRRQRRNLRLSY
ncbi:MAG: hypothetical protein ACR2JY_03975 [Chloroflexota bacterium]